MYLSCVHLTKLIRACSFSGGVGIVETEQHAKSLPDRSGIKAVSSQLPLWGGFVFRCGKGRRKAGLDSGARLLGRCPVSRDVRFPAGACDANRSRTAWRSPQGGGAKEWKANLRPKEHKGAPIASISDFLPVVRTKQPKQQL